MICLWRKVSFFQNGSRKKPNINWHVTLVMNQTALTHGFIDAAQWRDKRQLQPENWRINRVKSVYSLVGKLNSLLDRRLEFWLQCFQPFLLKVWEWPQIKNLLHTVLPQPHLNHITKPSHSSTESRAHCVFDWCSKFRGLPLRQRKEAQWLWIARTSILQHLELRWVPSSMHQRIALQHSCDNGCQITGVENQK